MKNLKPILKYNNIIEIPIPLTIRDAEKTVPEKWQRERANTASDLHGTL